MLIPFSAGEGDISDLSCRGSALSRGMSSGTVARG